MSQNPFFGAQYDLFSFLYLDDENSVAMGNAEEKVRGAAKYVTKSVEENGIYYGLQMVGLL
jgi:hypothetical protein